MDRKSILSDVVDSTICARAHFDSWWSLSSEKDESFRDVMQSHSEYFATALNANYTAFFVYFAHLFEKRTDSSSIATYISALRAEQGDSSVEALNAEYEALRERAKPLLIIRHKTVAHIEKTLSGEDLFFSGDITWNEVHQIISDTIIYIIKLCSAKSPGEIGIPRSGRLHEATHRLLDALLNKSDLQHKCLP